MFLDSSGRPKREKIQNYLQQISNSMDMVKKDRDYIIALEKQTLETRKNTERAELRKRRLLEHNRIQDLLDIGVIKSSELMRQEIRDFKLLHEEINEEKTQLARCPSPSPVKETPVFDKKKSIFLTTEFIRKVLTNDFKRVVIETRSKEGTVSDVELDYSDPILREMTNAAKVEELYGLAEKVVYTTEEGCKDIKTTLN